MACLCLESRQNPDWEPSKLVTAWKFVFFFWVTSLDMWLMDHFSDFVNQIFHRNLNEDLLFYSWGKMCYVNVWHWLDCADESCAQFDKMLFVILFLLLHISLVALHLMVWLAEMHVWEFGSETCSFSWALVNQNEYYCLQTFLSAWFRKFSYCLQVAVASCSSSCLFWLSKAWIVRFCARVLECMVLSGNQTVLLVLVVLYATLVLGLSWIVFWCFMTIINGGLFWGNFK